MVLVVTEAVDIGHDSRLSPLVLERNTATATTAPHRRVRSSSLCVDFPIPSCAASPQRGVVLGCNEFSHERFGEERSRFGPHSCLHIYHNYSTSTCNIICSTLLYSNFLTGYRKAVHVRWQSGTVGWLELGLDSRLVGTGTHHVLHCDVVYCLSI